MSSETLEFSADQAIACIFHGLMTFGDTHVHLAYTCRSVWPCMSGCSISAIQPCKASMIVHVSVLLGLIGTMPWDLMMLHNNAPTATVPSNCKACFQAIYQRLCFVLTVPRPTLLSPLVFRGMRWPRRHCQCKDPFELSSVHTDYSCDCIYLLSSQIGHWGGQLAFNAYRSLITRDVRSIWLLNSADNWEAFDYVESITCYK